MSDSPTVSVVLPLYNGEEYITDAIDSVLEQTYEDFELLVVDDGSTDRSIGLVRSYGDDRITLYRNETNLGIGRNMNRGVDLSEGRILAFLDQDDYWRNNKLEHHVSAHEATGAAVVYSDVETVTANKEFVESVDPPEPAPSGEPLVRQLYVYLNFIRTFSSVTIERTAWKAFDGLDPQFNVAADYDLYLRLAPNHDFALVDEPLVSKRIHEQNTSKDYGTAYEDIQRILAEARERHPYLNDLSPDEFQEYGFQRGFWAYRAGKRREAIDYCLASLRHGVRPFTVLLLGVLLLDSVTGPHRIGTRGYRLYSDLKVAQP